MFASSHLASRVSSEPRYVAPSARLENPIEESQNVLVDEVVAAEVAAAVAQETDLLITPNVTNRAVTLDTQATMSAQTDEGTTPQIDKPVIVSDKNASKQAILKITTKAGDTVASLAREYGISQNTIRWANGLSSGDVQTGVKLTILPVSGVLYTVQQGDTVESIARAYKTKPEEINAFNDVETKGLQTGVQIVVPNGIKPTPAFVPTQTPISSSSYPFGGSTPLYGGNRYAYGYCTYYAYNKRAAAGNPVASNWGNASTWASLASASGYSVDKNPRVGDVFQTSGGFGGYGHVGYVEKVNRNSNGTVTGIVVSEMNYAGWNVVSSRTISASQIGLYNFIH